MDLEKEIEELKKKHAVGERWRGSRISEYSDLVRKIQAVAAKHKM